MKKMKKIENIKKYLLIMTLITATVAGAVACNGPEVLSETASEEITESTTETESETQTGDESESVSEEQTEERTEEQSEEVSEETVSAEKEEKTSEIPTEEVPEVSEEQFTVTDMDATMYAQRNCNVRKGPGTTYEKIGSLKLNDEVTVTGKTDNNWYRISFTGEDAYVSASLLSGEKVDTSVKETTPSDSGQESSEETNPPASDDDDFWDGFGLDFPEAQCYAEPKALELVNKLRREYGVQEVAWDSSAEEACKARAEAMRDNGKCDHGVDGGPPHAECLYQFMTVNPDKTAQASIRAYADEPNHYGLMMTGQYRYMCCATCIAEHGRSYNVLWMYN